jgi:hypothetical protein
MKSCINKSPVVVINEISQEKRKAENDIFYQRRKTNVISYTERKYIDMALHYVILISRFYL